MFPHAVLLTEKLDARIADLGLATFVQDDDSSQTHTHGGGTRCYEAPEVANLKFSSKADMFSASVMFYEMATGKLPDMQSINSDTMFDPLKSDPQTLELLKFMLKMDSAERPTAKDLNSKISTLITIIEPMDEVDSGEALLGRELTSVEKAVLASARRLATEGTGENAPAHGLCFVGGDAAKLMEIDEDGDGVTGTIGKPQFNYLKLGLEFTVKNFDAIQSLAKEDGAVLFDIRTGALLGGNYRINNIAKGDQSGGTRHQAASAVAQQAGRCFVIKVGEDHCGCTKTPPSRAAMLKVFDRCKMPVDVPVQP